MGFSRKQAEGEFLIEANQEAVAAVYPACLRRSVLLAFMEFAHRGPIAANGFTEPRLLAALSGPGPISPSLHADNLLAALPVFR